MLFSLRLGLLLFIIVYANGETNDIDSTNTIKQVENDDSTDERLAVEEGQTEELITTTEADYISLDQDQLSAMEMLRSPCAGTSTRPLKKFAYLKDSTKYVQCHDEFHYEIVPCPNGGKYDEDTDTCTVVVPKINKCEENNPCLNSGQCIPLEDSEVKCSCHPDWTGERCETPKNSCVKRPCGPNAHCRILKTIDYDQDYVCICHSATTYGLNCQEVVPNPCLTSDAQFFPFVFSQRAYVQCHGELIHFQRCSSLLFWNQEEMVCDRKRPTKYVAPTSATKLITTNHKGHQGTHVKKTKEEKIITRIMAVEQNKKENDETTTFIPARVANREELLSNFAAEQEKQQQQQQSEPTVESVDSIQTTENTIIEPVTTLSTVNQALPQATTEEQSTSTSTEASVLTSTEESVVTSTEESVVTSTEESVVTSTTDSSQIDEDDIPYVKPVYPTEILLDPIPEPIQPTYQYYPTQAQSWQQYQNYQNQPIFGYRYPSTPTPTDRFYFSQGFQHYQRPIQSWHGYQTQQWLQGHNQPKVVETTTFTPQLFLPQDSLSRTISRKHPSINSISSSNMNQMTDTTLLAKARKARFDDLPNFSGHSSEDDERFLKSIKNITKANDQSENHEILEIVRGKLIQSAGLWFDNHEQDLKK
ncbi:unnamed protein product [Rotaria magnacalcarata]|uniref:Uncharacterized protein n=1 Tax=Rotaria magnacalcarata TaxID=392030 RepID=A0A816RI39_9BILA|nr:unnamed protein product [Rotaria magnacalcarata]